MDAARKLFDSLSVADFGLGISAALVTRFLTDAGAKITRTEPSSGDPFYKLQPAYESWRKGSILSRAETLSKAVESASAILAAADVCVIGGEDYPGLDWRIDVEALARRHPHLVILEIGGYPHGTVKAELPSVDLLVQADTGLVHEQYSDRPMVYALPAPSYGAALEGLAGLLAALVDRERTGKGQIAHTSLFEGTLTWLVHSWFASERSDWSMDIAVPKDSVQLIFRCADAKYIQFTLVTANARENVYKILGIAEEPGADGGPRSGLPSLAMGPRNFYGDIDLLQSQIGKWNRQNLLERFWALGLSAEPVNEPGEAWEDPQVVHNGTIWKEVDGGRRVGLPFRLNMGARTDYRTAPKSSDDAPPLEGVRIIDFGCFAAGPYASMPLADLGADVIKVEPLEGDPIHSIFRPYSTGNRGKRHIAIDIKKPEGLAIAHRLCKSADIVHHNYRPGVAKRLGIDPETLLQVNPSLIVLQNSGYGSTGPKSPRAGIDFAFQALCGHEVHAGGQSGDYVCYKPTTVDFAAAMLGTITTLAAHWYRQRTGCGAIIETSLLDTGLFLLSELVQAPDGRFLPLPKLNREQTGFHPAEQLYRARDGWIAIAARGEEMSRRLLGVLDLESKIRVPRSAWRAAEARLIADAMARHDVASLETALRAADVWAALCREDPKDKDLDDPELRALNIVLSTQHERYGDVRQSGKLFSLSRSRTTPSGHTAVIGEHSGEILTELGYDDAQIAKLCEAHVVVAA
jgi:crotonobetainyl-CoA:carnitine CoA-transferase CaiB-like acyl-CoA transferase